MKPAGSSVMTRSGPGRNWRTSTARLLGRQGEDAYNRLLGQHFKVFLILTRSVNTGLDGKMTAVDTLGCLPFPVILDRGRASHGARSLLSNSHDFPALAFPPFLPAFFFCAVVPP